MALMKKGEQELITKQPQNPPINTPPLCTVFGEEKEKNQSNFGQFSLENPTKLFQARTRKKYSKPKEFGWWNSDLSVRARTKKIGFF